MTHFEMEGHARGTVIPPVIHPALPPFTGDDFADPLILNIGCGKHPIPRMFNIDQTVPDPLPPWFWQADLDDPDLRLPWGDAGPDEEGFEGVYGSHVIEHIARPLPLMQELWRVCEPGAVMVLRCPYGSSDDAWENPTHVRPYYMGSWAAFGQPYYWREDYGYTADWQLETVEIILYPQFETPPEVDFQQGIDHLLHLVRHSRNVVAEQVAILRCNKPARPADRQLQSDYNISLQRRVQINGWESEIVDVATMEVKLMR